MRFNIRIKILLSITVCVVSLSLAAGITSIKLMEKFLLQQYTDRLIDTAKHLDFKINTFLSLRMKHVESLSSNKTVGLCLLDSRKSTVDQVKDLFLTLSDNYSELVLLNKSGLIIARVVNGVVSVKTEVDSQNYLKLWGLDSDLFGVNGSVTLAGVQDTIRIAQKVVDHHDKLRGYIIGLINYEKLFSMLESTNIDKDFVIQIIDEKKGYISGKAKEPILSEIYDKELFSPDELVRVERRGRQFLIINKPIEILGWNVLVSFPFEKFRKDIQILGRSIFYIALIIVFIGTILSYYISKKITKPILLINAASRSIAGGDYSARIITDTKDELSDLAVSFNRMAKEINDSQNEIIDARDSLDTANNEINNLIQRAMTDVGARYVNLSLVKCWEIKGCGRENCVSYQSGNLRCWQMDGTFRTNDGQAIVARKKKEKCEQCEVYRKAVSDPASSIGESFNSLMDILNLKHRQLEQACDKLQITQVQLLQQEKMASIGTLAGGIAHEFNNILAAMLGYASLARDDAPLGSEVREDLGKIIKAGKRAKDLVRQILTFSRQGEEDLSPIHIYYVINEAVKLLETTTPSSVKVRCNINSDCKSVLANSTMIHQVIINLYTNAVQAMSGKGVLGIDLEKIIYPVDYMSNISSFAPGEYIRLTISDNGPGIDPLIKDRIFDPFFTTKKVGQGTGMGLSVVHGIVDKFGGFITVNSELGQGAAFHVFFPTINQKELVQYEENHEPIVMGKESILFIDDEMMLAHLGKQMLERLGYKVSARTSSVEALEAFRAQPDKYDLVITDQTMPNITGDELAIRILEIRPDMPIILCSGFDAVISEERTKKIGISAFVMKPMDKRLLANTIRKALEV